MQQNVMLPVTINGLSLVGNQLDISAPEARRVADKRPTKTRKHNEIHLESLAVGKIRTIQPFKTSDIFSDNAKC